MVASPLENEQPVRLVYRPQRHGYQHVGTESTAAIVPGGVCARRVVTTSCGASRPGAATAARHSWPVTRAFAILPAAGGQPCRPARGQYLDAAGSGPTSSRPPVKYLADSVGMSVMSKVRAA